MIRIIKYRTINSCLAAYYECKVSELDSIEGTWYSLDSKGVEDTCPNQEAIASIRKLNAWGWIEGKEDIHCFFRKKASMHEIIGLLSHEIGHTQRPFHRDLVEEQKACKYASVACDAFNLAVQIKDSFK
jgi:hypothetical protein